MNEHLRAKILDTSQGTTGIKTSGLERLRSQLMDLAHTVPAPDYDQYIRSETWKAKRSQFLNDSKHRCVFCGDKKLLHVHHLHYQSVGDEKPGDVVVCCRRCHFIDHLPRNDDPQWAGTSSAQHRKRKP